MQVKLIPISESGLAEIIISDQVFSIGRNHEPFESYPADIVNQLSRRHARIFKENGQIFLVDTGSRNGTSLNGNKLDDKPVSISNGDVIGFSNKLIYSVVIEDQKSPDSTILPGDAEIRLTLVPGETTLEPIILTRFPFLVSKTDRSFARYPPEYAQDVRYISRKHAYFYTKNTEVYIEDLGSTNGTYVNETRLSEQAVPLKNGDTVGLGGKRLVYTVNISVNYPTREARTEDLYPGAETPTRSIIDEQKTTFVANPNSFLEIFCSEEEEPETPADEINPEINRPATSPKPAKTAIGRFYRRSRIFLQQARAALSEETGSTKRTWIIGAALLLIIAGGSILYWKDASKRDIQEFMEQANYERSLELANEYLDKHPDDEDVRKIATEAMLKFRVPLWLDFIQDRKYQDAQELVRESAEEDTAHNKENAELVEVLKWVGDLEQFVDNRGGIEAPLFIFKHEQPIAELLEWWERDEESHSKTLQLIASSVPQFKAIHLRTFRDLRILKNDQSLYLKAIDQLKATIARRLESNQASELGGILDKFAKQYPRIKGINQVRSELESFLTLEREIERRNLPRIIAFLSETPLTIPLFREKVDELRKNELPSEEFRASYLRSSEAWRNGNIDEAINLLAQLNKTGWQEFVSPELERKKDIRDRFRVLGATLGTESYGSELLDFYRLLDKEEDIHFLDAIDSEVKEQRKSISLEAEKEMELAQSAWQSYLANGRITGIQRLESGISRVFSSQAKRLSEAYRHAERGMRSYEAAQVGYAPALKSLYDEILRETKLQRQSLTERENVLDPAILKAKLKLLPESSYSVTDDPVEP